MFIVPSINSKLSLHHFTRYFHLSAMSYDKCKIAVCQLTSTNNKEKNLSVLRKLVAQAAVQSAKVMSSPSKGIIDAFLQVVFLPEGSDYVAQSSEETRAMAESLDGNLMQQYKALAKQHNIWLSVGGFHERHAVADGKKFKQRNAHVLINDEGDIVSVYRKLHLYDVFIPEKNIDLKESDMVERGEEIVPPVSTPAGQLSLSIVSFIV